MPTAPRCDTPSAATHAIVIGSMKCGTTSMLRYLATHPDIGAAPQKEVNFFFGSSPDGPGQWWRGWSWYQQQMPADCAVRAEASPGYTSPDHPEVAGRMHELLPGARLLYLVRDPLSRAVSQYRHHRRDGAEPRDLADALLDPGSHYVRRSRFHARLRPFLDVYPAAQIGIVEHDDLLHRTAATVAAVQRWLGLEPHDAGQALEIRHNTADVPSPEVDADVATRFHELVADDAAAFAAVRDALVPLTPAWGTA